MRSHIYQKLLELDQKLPQGSALSLTLTKVKYPQFPAKLPIQDLALKPQEKSRKPKSAAAEVTLKPKVKTLNGVEAQVEIFSPNGQMTARGFGSDLFESVSGSVATLIEEIEVLRASVQGDGNRRAIIELAKRPQYLH
ncbi:MAG: hypothetical protein K2X47_01260 [Bdellovibrionales bacterium]|nr:hypothetical protein [Bdellovibrionales bacterium]